MRLLIVEDEENLAAALAAALDSEAYAVDLALTGSEAEELVGGVDYDLVILDWTIPPPSGIELLRMWRAEGKDFPVLMLTGRSAVRDRVDGLDTGADDYLVKPFSFSEMLARVRSLLRRRSKAIQVLQAGDLELERGSRRVTVGGRALELPPKEFGILEYLLARADETVSRGELVEHVWDDSHDSLSNVIDVIMYRLRKKIDGGRTTKLLHTVKGVGYILTRERV
jgi:DNA-binding response OmpR family regulator